MNREQATEKLKAIIKPYVHNQQAFENMNDETDFINNLQVNSANLVDIVLDIEEKFNIEIDNESMEKMLDVKSALLIIQQKLGYDWK